MIDIDLEIGKVKKLELIANDLDDNVKEMQKLSNNLSNNNEGMIINSLETDCQNIINLFNKKINEYELYIQNVKSNIYNIYEIEEAETHSIEDENNDS